MSRARLTCQERSAEEDRGLRRPGCPALRQVSPRPGVIGEEEADPGELQEVVIDGFELVRERVNARDRETEAGIEFVRDAERIGLEAQAQERAVAGEGVGESPDMQLAKVLSAECDATELLGLETDEADRPAIRPGRPDRLEPHGLVEERAVNNLARV
jgi:hypothetical protein